MSLLRYFRLTARSRRAYAVYIENAAGYSSDEIDTGITWIDGSVIYRKVVSIGALPNATSKAVAHGISDLGQVVRVEGVATNGDFRLPMPNCSASAVNANIAILVDGTNVTITTGIDRSLFTGYVVLDFTKA